MKFINFAAFFVSLFIFAGCVTTGGTRIDNVPMYGQPETPRPESLKKADEDFIKKASSRFGGREKASKIWWSQAEKYMAQNNLDYAMRRYNQSWLLNPKNYQPYWGFARVLVTQDKIDEGITFFEKSISLIDDPYQEVALLSDMGSAYYYKALNFKGANEQYKKHYLQLSNESFIKSTTLDPSYPNSWQRWAFTLYEGQNYYGAWEKIKKARSLGARPYSESFLNSLKEKMPEPK